ncbi:MAG: tRNA uridine-5-carboxymethylaminomethyl(34) synthesis GTPase MnmE, partial [Candidatus Eisenbacteria bacterium]
DFEPGPPRRVIVALNKSDLPCCVSESEVARLLNGAEHRCVRVSARSGDGVDRVRKALAGITGAEDGTLSAAVSNARHTEALGRARSALSRAARSACAGAPGEIVALELRESLGAIGEVTGQAVGEDLLDRIFARFCVGK